MSGPGLLGCPWCGRQPLEHMRPAKHDKHGRAWATTWSLKCSDLAHGVVIGPYRTKAEAVAAWNRRAGGAE